MIPIDGSPASGDPQTPVTLTSIRENLLVRIHEITSAPKPNYNIDGQQVSWQSYLDSLMASLQRIDEQLLNDEPYEIVSRGVT